MNVKSNTGKALSLSILSTFLCLCMLFGMTYAWFKVSVESAENTIKIGAFEANVYYSDSYNPITWNPVVKDTSVIFNTTLIPGTEVVRYFKLENECEYAVKFDIALPAGATLDGDDKASSLIVYAADGVTAPVTTESMTQLNNLKSLSDTATDQLPVQLLSKIVPAGASAIVAVGIKLPDTYNTVSASAVDETFKLRFIATQWNVAHGESTVTNAAAEQTLTAQNVTVTVPADDVVAGDKLSLVVSDIDESTAGTFRCDITLKKNGKPVESADSPITVEINIGTEKTVTSVKHNGVELSPNYTYDPTTGILSFTTSSFSPFEIKFIEGVYEASIGEQKYETLAEAIEKANNSKSAVTISVLTNIQQSGSLTINNSVTINGGNHSITTVGTATSGNMAAFYICDTEANKPITVNVKDLTINSTKHSRVFLLNGDYCTYDNTNILNVDNLKITTDGQALYSNGPSTINATNCDIRHEGQYLSGKDAVYYSALIVGYNGRLNIRDSKVSSFGNGAATFPSGGTVDIRDTEITAFDDFVDSSTGYLFWARHEKSYDTGAWKDYCGSAIINVYSGVFKGPYKITDDGATSANRIADINIFGGKFDNDPTAYLASGYQAAETNGVWTVTSTANSNSVNASSVSVSSGLLPELITP